MSKHSKCNVCVLSSTGRSWTTKRGARRLADRGLAVYESERILRMIESDHRYESETPAAGTPTLNVIEFRPRTTAVLTPYGYLRYPDGGKESIKRSIRRMREAA